MGVYCRKIVKSSYLLLVKSFLGHLRKYYYRFLFRFPSCSITLFHYLSLLWMSSMSISSSVISGSLAMSSFGSSTVNSDHHSFLHPVLIIFITVMMGSTPSSFLNCCCLPTPLTHCKCGGLIFPLVVHHLLCLSGH